MGAKLFKKSPVIDYIAITIGAALMAIGIGVFLVEAHVVPGGVTGLAMAVHYLSDNKIPIGLLVWFLNIPLLIWGVKELGKRFGIRTFYGFTLNAIFIALFRGEIPGLEFIRLQDTQTVQDLLHNDFLFLVLVGGALLGIGLGIVFKFRGTTAGTDIVAAIMQKRFGMKPGQAIMIIDFLVITIAGLIIGFKDLSPDRPAFTLTLYALFLLFVSARIINELSRGATAIKTRGLYKNVEREMIYTIVTLKELSKLTEIINEVDPDAFVVISNVHEVLGSGFRRRI